VPGKDPVLASGTPQPDLGSAAACSGLSSAKALLGGGLKSRRAQGAHPFPAGSKPFTILNAISQPPALSAGKAWEGAPSQPAAEGRGPLGRDGWVALPLSPTLRWGGFPGASSGEAGWQRGLCCGPNPILCCWGPQRNWGGGNPGGTRAVSTRGN